MAPSHSSTAKKGRAPATRARRATAAPPSKDISDGSGNDTEAVPLAITTKNKGKAMQATVAKKPAARTTSRKRAAPEPQDSDDYEEDSEYCADPVPKKINKGNQKNAKSTKNAKSSSDTWLEDEASRRNPHIPLTLEQRRALGRTAGRGLIPWTRPHMNDKLLLIMYYELARHQIEVPWDEVAHRLHPGSSGGAINQHLNRVRLDLAGKGHLVPPPIPKTNGSGFSTDPTVRGYMREDDEDTGSVKLVPVKYNHVWEDRKVNLPDGFDASAKLLAAEAMPKPSKKRGGSRTSGARSIAVPHSRAKKGSNSRAQAAIDPADLNSDSEFDPQVTARRTRRKVSSKHVASIEDAQSAGESDDGDVEDAEDEEDDSTDEDNAAKEHSSTASNSDDDFDGNCGGASASHGHAEGSTPGTPPSQFPTPETEDGHHGHHNSANPLGIDYRVNKLFAENPMLSAVTAAEMEEALYTVGRTVSPEFCPPVVPTPIPANIAVMRRSDTFAMAPEPKIDFSEYLNSDSASGSPIVGFGQTIEGFCTPNSQIDGQSGLPSLGHGFSASAQFHGRGAFGSAYAQAGSYHSHGHFIGSTNGGTNGGSNYQSRSMEHFEQECNPNPLE
ncbi:heat shock protein mitochondrial precursor [Ophiostoma piceae UAMH 11346]|uniref:Heat shock protein mitochondrial n=1 Tax=Ophiostoma piceae (strain UAMH 11346) TaxID=1262450 RepID=S3CLP5_OPHP1|nr:heat shock protein mitochondrial precursor [Ophiostoma piceae UAMH 11346]